MNTAKKTHERITCKHTHIKVYVCPLEERPQIHLWNRYHVHRKHDCHVNFGNDCHVSLETDTQVLLSVCVLPRMVNA